MNQKTVWNKIAPAWAEYRTVVSPTVKNFLKDKKGKVLDLGCGSGRNFEKKKGRKIYAVDFSEEMLSYAKSEAENKKIDVEFICASSEKLPFEDNYFDSILCWAVMHCVETEEKRKKTISEMYRVLKPNSSALISTWGRNSPKLKDKEKECFVPWASKLEKSQERYTYIYDLDELKKQLEDAGFKIVKIWEERNINAIVQKVSC
jgi:ubiquinone/menaquinone biosynthesis C-methylase UbiE